MAAKLAVQLISFGLATLSQDVAAYHVGPSTSSPHPTSSARDANTEIEPYVKPPSESEMMTPLSSGSGTNRRRFFQGCAALLSSEMMTTIIPEPANAAAPISQGEAQNVGAQTKRLLRDKPPRILRPRLDKDFAVLLMRSSYNVLDELDCVAMDQFQRDFFIIRQAEYEPYINQLGPGMVSQGDLTDPYYFDFISFAQYTAISREMTQDPPYMFQEKQPVQVADDQPQQFQDVVIRRDPALMPNNLLPVEHSRRVGRRVLDRLNEIFDQTASAIPKVGSDSTQLQAGMQQLVKLFVLNGYALDGSVTVENQSATPMQLVISLASPATLWGGKALIKERSAVTNSFLLNTAVVLAERYGYVVSSTNVKYEGTREINYLTLR